MAKQQTVNPMRKSLTKDDMRDARQFTTDARNRAHRQPSIQEMPSETLLHPHQHKVSQGSQLSKGQIARENPSTLYDGKTIADDVSNVSPPMEMTQNYADLTIDVAGQSGTRNINLNNKVTDITVISRE